MRLRCVDFPPARYYPFNSGVYEVAAGLRPLGTDFGNGDADRRVFQIDRDFARFRENKLACRANAPDEHIVRDESDAATERAVTEWLIDRFTSEYPQLFRVTSESDGRRVDCRHTGDVLRIDHHRSNFDTLVGQMPEDVCVLRVDETGRDWLAAAHVCSPSGWSPREKVGRPFTAIHAPVAHIERINAAASQFVDAMIHRGPYVRFVWGIATDDQLNHHPNQPRRAFDPNDPKLFVRVERQVTWGLPQVRAAVFTIRVSHVNVEDIRRDPAQRRQLVSALRSMSPQSLRYKGLADSIGAILKWIES
jgi:hypothetical protein